MRSSTRLAPQPRLCRQGLQNRPPSDAPTREIIEEKTYPKIEKFGIQFSQVPARPDNEAGYVSIQGDRFMVTMTLDRLLALTRTKP